MSEIVWDPAQTKDAQKSDGYGVVVQRRSISFWMDNKWRGIPANHWAWTFVAREQTDGLFRRVWVPKLLPSGDDGRQWDSAGEELRPSRPTPSLANRRGFRGTDFPPELFKRICHYADRTSARLRLVNRYWEQQCTRHVFERISVTKTPQRLGPLLAVTRDPSYRFIPLVTSIDVPDYTADTTSPWLHFLGQLDIPVAGQITISGPLRKRHRTIRTIHFAVPRSLPSSFSRGIRSLTLEWIHFQRHEDLTSLVSELPDLEKLNCPYVTFGSLPTGPWRRRPRKSRNNLKHVSLAVEETDLKYGVCLLVPNTFSAVYDTPSFFDDSEILVICALLLLQKPLMVPRISNLHSHYEYDPESKSRLFEQGEHNMKFTLRARPESTVIYCLADQLNTDMAGCNQLAAACRSLSRPPQFVIGVRAREELLDFNAGVVEKMPLLFRPGAVHYSLESSNGAWHLTSLDSDELHDEGKRDITDVYP